MTDHVTDQQVRAALDEFHRRCPDVFPARHQMRAVLEAAAEVRAIERSLDDVEAGRVVPHAEAMAEIEPLVFEHHPKVTRLVIVDRNGRRLDEKGVRVGLSWQDGGRTLKVFVG